MGQGASGAGILEASREQLTLAPLCGAAGLTEEEKKKRAERAKRFGTESFEDKKQVGVGVRGEQLCVVQRQPGLALE